MINRKITPIEELLSPLKNNLEHCLQGLSGSLASMALASIANQPEISLLLTSNKKRAVEISNQVADWLGPARHRVICFLPERETIYDHTATEPEIIYDRIRAMSASKRGGCLIVIPACTIVEKFYNPSRWLNKSIYFQAGDESSREETIKKLIEAGYKRTNLVEEPGCFAVRGSLIDVFPPDRENPVRLDYFGDELDSIKDFSANSQRSFNKRKNLTIIPALEFIPNQEEIELLIDKTSQIIKKIDKTRSAMLERKVEHVLSHADARDYKELFPFVEEGKASIFDFWPEARIFIEDAEVLFESFGEIYEEITLKYDQVKEISPLAEPENYYHSPEFLIKFLASKPCIPFSRFGKAENVFASEIEMLPPPSDPSRETLIKELQQLAEDKWATALMIADENRFQNLKGLLAERKIKVKSAMRPFDLKFGAVSLIQGSDRKGFKDYRSKVAVFTEEDIYPGPAKTTRKTKHATQQDILAISQMVPGDIVVHADHGVAEFRGIKTMTAAGNTREYLLLKYDGTDKLYVPTDQVHKVSKYIGMEGFTPRIHKLNSKVWQGQKRRVRKNVEAIAHELLDLYAKRQQGEGYAFESDSELQVKMEEDFPFVETPDQLKAIIATKEDMETALPMDRLICGDVGYGKTEVAMRAAFKAVCSGKQVAVLAPTTLLAFQHYQTFKNRFDGFPVSIDMVSRLRKPSEQKKTIKNLKSGVLDILIGTHRLLSSDFSFPRLGLLVVDEEQRFGVKHKERLKQLKAHIDVLTLTATPIPRTLQMSMSGIRQISVIDTAPVDRKPVQTYVAPFDSGWVKRAIIEELKRGGQIFYVYNRVEKIEQKAAFLEKLVPEARIKIAHGQMHERQVEKTMLEFVSGKFDLLLATTIIESGLDIPNVNTLIVDEAQKLGLSQMYQLRGRVGRSKRQAWAYFFYSGKKKLTKEAMERLETIEEHTALGSGFKIALRDLQIRGAGNILGETQSGHISSIGFSLYMELLEEAVSRIKIGGSGSSAKIDTSIEIPITAYFPQSYIPEEENRVELYARISRCRDTALLDILNEECVDRFGTMPFEAENLFKISRLRILASQAGIIKISRIINHLRVEFEKNSLPDINLLLGAEDDFVRKIYLDPSEQNSINFNLESDDSEEIIYEARYFIKRLRDLTEKEQQ
ncbi:MAG: transcription-repair coupling factor [Candidatus Rifleibacteriota bacterium]